MENERRCTTVDLNVHLLQQCYHRNRLGALIGMRLLTQKERLLEQGRLLRKKQIRGGCLLSTVLNILLFKRVSSRFLRTVVSYRAVSYPNLVHSYPV